MKTRFLSLALAVFLLFSLAACKSVSPPPLDNDASGTSEAITTESAPPEAVLYDGKPIVKYLGGTADEITVMMGVPLGDSGDNPPSRIDYDGIHFWYDDGIFVRAEVYNLDLLEVDGVPLDKNRAGLIGLLGEPAHEWWGDDDEWGPEDVYSMAYQLTDCSIIFDFFNIDEAPVLAHVQERSAGGGEQDE